MWLRFAVLDRYRAPAAGLARVRWFFLCFVIFTLVSASLQTMFSSPVPAQWRIAVVPAFAYLLWCRLREYRRGALLPAGWEPLELAAVFGCLLAAGPLEGGLGVLYGAVFFRTVHGSSSRVAVGCVAYLAALVGAGWVVSTLSPVADEGWLHQVGANVVGVVFSTLLMQLMLTTLIDHQSALTEERRLLSAVLDNVDSAVVATDSDGQPVVRNQAAVDLYRELGLADPTTPWQEAVKLHRTDELTAVRPADVPLARILQGHRVRDEEIVIGLDDGAYRSFNINGQPLTDGDTGRAAAVFTITDVTARKKAEQRLSHLALHDPLTGLTNRVLLRDRIEHALARRSTGEKVHLLFLDLDGFKTVNDSLGHPVGDHVLVAVGDRLRAVVRAQDTVARLGGDEFAVLVEDGPEQAHTVAERMLASLHEPVVIQDRSVAISASIGMAACDGAEDADELLRNADLAMYAAKEHGNRVETFHPLMHHAAMEQLTLQADLRLALERNELFLQYQPVVSLITGQMTGVEALVRWRHPERGMVPPLDFIPAGEASGLIRPIGSWVIKEAARQLQSWRRHHPAAYALTMAVNVAVSQLESGQLVDTVASAIADHQLAPADLVLEITESAMSEHAQVLPTLRDLRRLGVALALDDFGTGYSSLSRLRMFPVQKVKVDRSFVEEIEYADSPAVLPAATLGLAHGLGLDAVAEGVETSEQLEFLRSHGCTEAQGYLFSRPLDAEGIDDLLSGGRSLGADRVDDLPTVDRELAPVGGRLLATG